MSRSVRARLCGAVLILSCAAPAQAGVVSLDVATAVARARERAPVAVAVGGRVAEAQAGRAGASVLVTQNPELQLGAGRRFGDPRSLAVQGQVTQMLELGRRGPRIRATEAAIAHARAEGDDALRELSLEVELVFYEARFAELAVALAQRNEEVAQLAATTAGRRRQAGDITDLEANLATLALGRAHSAVQAAEAARWDAIGRLAVLVGAEPEDELSLVGELRPAAVQLATMRTAATQRADVRARAAEATLARAEGAVATANARPDLGVWLGYQIDEGDSIVLAGLSVTLPLWSRGQGERAVAQAKGKRADQEGAALASTARRQVNDAYAAFTRADQAVAVFEAEVLPTLDDSDALLARSVETGQIAISDFLVARQQLLEARREYLQRQLELAQAAARARYIAGVTP